MKTLNAILSTLRDELPNMKKRFSVEQIGVFGSFARNQQTENSDVDILVEFNDQKYPDLFVFMEFEDYLRRILRNKVDLVPKDALKKRIGEKILSEVINV